MEPVRRPAVTYLFVPAHDGRKVAKALACDSDAIILDLEDSVPDDQKEAARRHVLTALDSVRDREHPPVWIRVNAGGGDLEKDIDAVDWTAVEGAFVPMARDERVLHRLVAAGATHVIPIIETAGAFTALPQLAAVTGVTRFAIGTFDLALDLGLLATPNPDDAELIWQLRGMLVVASRQLGLEPPLDGVFARVDDESGLRDVCERSRRLGYGGKMIIHPRHIDIVRSVFEPSADELQRAREIVEAYDRATLGGRGAIVVQGRAIDRPMATSARALLARWRGAARQAD